MHLIPTNVSAAVVVAVVVADAVVGCPSTQEKEPTITLTIRIPVIIIVSSFSPVY
jgi:hypothetical protein